MHTVLHRRRSTVRFSTTSAALLSGALLGSALCAPAAEAAQDHRSKDQRTTTLTASAVAPAAARAVEPAAVRVVAVPAVQPPARPVAAPVVAPVKALLKAPTAVLVKPMRALLGPSRTVHRGQPTTLGAYTARSTGVVLQRYQGKSWTHLGVRRTDGSGRAFFRVAPGRTSHFRIVTSNSAAATSGVARITVAQQRRGVAIVTEASKYRGVRYRHGGSSPRGFDCSGFTQFIYGKFGRSLPHSATAQARYGKPVAKAAARPGDLVLFGRGGRYHHAAIYAGRGYMWDSSTHGRPVGLRRIYSNAYVVRRVI